MQVRPSAPPPGDRIDYPKLALGRDSEADALCLQSDGSIPSALFMVRSAYMTHAQQREKMRRRRWQSPSIPLAVLPPNLVNVGLRDFVIHQFHRLWVRPPSSRIQRLAPRTSRHLLRTRSLWLLSPGRSDEPAQIFGLGVYPSYLKLCDVPNLGQGRHQCSWIEKRRQR